MTNRRPLLVVSACLLGHRVRYDGELLGEPALVTALEEHFEVAPCCPEFELGLGVPREPIQLEGDADAPRLVTRETRADLTEPMLGWCHQRVDELASQGVCGIVLKSRSPSCGIASCELHCAGELVGVASGLFARTFLRRFPGLPAAEESELLSPERLTRFIGLLRARFKTTR